MADCMVGFSLGAGTHGLPGHSNKMLASGIMQYFHKHESIPLILPQEISTCLKHQPGIIMAKTIAPDQNSGKYLSTYGVALQASEVMKQNGWRTYVGIAHKDHLPRCIAVMKKLGFVVTETVFTELYDINSVQWWTRRALFFKPCNALATIFYKQRGWI